MRLGIDFGTTHTVVAFVDRGNYPIVSFDHGEHIPSIISVEPSGELRFGHTEPGWPTLRSIKRLLDGARPGTTVTLGQQTYPLVDLLARFLSHVRVELQTRSNAGLKIGEPLEAAIGVPANSSTAQRLITIDAFRRAGFEVKAVLNEPSAAAFEYAHRFRDTVTSKREYVLVYDLGGGTFDASLIRMEARHNDVVTSSGIAQLGGDDFDEAIARVVLGDSSADPSRELLDQVRAAKEALGPNTRRFMIDSGDEHAVLPVDEVYAACAPLVERTLEAMEPAMRDPRRGEDPVPWSELAGIYVVGGASSFPPVYRRLRERFGTHRVRRSPHPFGSCAIGLAIHLDEEKGYRLKERLTRHFGVFREDASGDVVSFDVLVPKDTELPAEVTRRYRPVHNVGHYRYVECSRIERGRPEGKLVAWDEFMFPFDPALRDAALAEIAVERMATRGPEVEEIYRCAEDGTVEASLRIVEDGFQRTMQLTPR